MNRFGVLSVLALLSGAPALQAQAFPTDRLPGATGSGSSIMSKPAELVASRVQNILRDHQNDLAWRELAGVLPEMALSGGADVESTFEAARIAEEMVVGGEVATPAPAVATSMLDRIDVGAIVAEFDRGLAAQLVALTLAIFALTMLLRGGPKSSTANSRRTTGGRYQEVRSLVDGGVPLYEIARRTGLARDAVAVLLERGVR